MEITVETEHRTEIPTALTDAVVYRTLGKMTSLQKLVLISCCWFHGAFECNFLSKKCQNDLAKELLTDCIIIFEPLVKTECQSSQGESCEMSVFYGS